MSRTIGEKWGRLREIRRRSITRLTSAVSSYAHREVTTEKATATPPPGTMSRERSPVSGPHILARIVIRVTMVRISFSTEFLLCYCFDFRIGEIFERNYGFEKNG